jgi:adenylate kinase family enzyme
MVESRQIGFEQLGIGSVLSRNILAVPLNQREYSWEERHITYLFNDLAKAIDDNAPEYFLGTIVTIPRKPGTLEVVDGQQRLATTVILLAAIRNALVGREADKLLVENIENTFLTTIDPAARARIARIRLNVTDGVFFEGRVLANDKDIRSIAVSHKRIDKAVELARQRVLTIQQLHSDKNYGDVLYKWVQFIEHQAIVILLKVPSDVNAYKMFETLNDRGLRTSQSDMVKNYLFGECGDRLSEAQQKWASMKTLLEAIEEDEDITINFLRQMLISMYGYLRESEVYEKVQRNAQGATLSLQFMTRLETGANDYVAMLNSEHEKWNKYPTSTRRAIQTLILLPMKPIRPLVLSILSVFDPKETDLSLKLLVNLSVRFLIVGGARSGVVEQTIATAAKGITGKTITKATELLQYIDKIVPNDHNFEEGFKAATVSQYYLARYYLRSLEMKSKNQPDPYFLPNEDQQIINLEHVLPEKPGDSWPQFTPEMANVFYKRLGNMTLLLAKVNSDLRSKPFIEKKEVYKESPYELTNQIAQIDEWTPDSIILRQAVMAKLAVQTWPVKIN